jgi:hypothetical protein
MIEFNELKSNKVYSDYGEGERKSLILVTQIKGFDNISFITFSKAINLIVKSVDYYNLVHNGLADFDDRFKQELIKRTFNNYREVDW